MNPFLVHVEDDTTLITNGKAKPWLCKIIMKGKPKNKLGEDEMWAYVHWKDMKPHERANKPDPAKSPKEQAMNVYNKRPKQNGLRKEWHGNRKHRKVGDPSRMDEDENVEKIDARYYCSNPFIV